VNSTPLNSATLPALKRLTDAASTAIRTNMETTTLVTKVEQLWGWGQNGGLLISYEVFKITFFPTAFDHEKGIPVTLGNASVGNAKSAVRAAVDDEPDKENLESGERVVTAEGLEADMAQKTTTPTGSLKTAPLMRVAADTPTRRSLREKVAKTVEAVINSPKRELPPPRRATPRTASAAATSTGKASSSNVLHASGGGVAKRSPAAARWHAALKKVATPDILKRAREIRICKQQPTASQQAKVPSPLASAAIVASTERLASASTTASRAKASHGEETKKERQPGLPPSHQIPPSVQVTRPKEFKMATSLRSQQRARQEHQHQPMKAGDKSDRADFSRMMKKFQQKMSGRQVVPSARAAGGGGATAARSVDRRRRPRSVDARARPVPTDTRGANGSAANTSGGGGGVLRRRSPSPVPFSFVEKDLAKVKEKAAEKIAQEKVHYVFLFRG